MAKSIKLGADTYLDASGVDGIKGTILSGDDLNNYYGVHKSGAWYVRADAANVSNCPKGWSTLIVTSYGDPTNQIIYNENAIYTRAYTGNPLAWSEWKKYQTDDAQTTTFTGNGITFTLAKNSGVCTLSALSGSLSSDFAANTAFATIPSGWRPKIGLEVTETSSGSKRISIGTSGAIQFSNAQTSGTYVRFSVTYVLA